jgi:hypothetical protein
MLTLRFVIAHVKASAWRRQEFTQPHLLSPRRWTATCREARRYTQLERPHFGRRGSLSSLVRIDDPAGSSRSSRLLDRQPDPERDQDRAGQRAEYAARRLTA